ncbi:MAG: VWA domain-containing protein [Acidobacteriota bacterium]|nr:MAG: VWA domain-containing protein [Acidobacteriota bacterium]
MKTINRPANLFVFGLLFLTGTAAFGQTETVIRERTELVTLTVSVTDQKGRAVPGIEPHEFEVYEDKIRQQIEYYRTDDAPLSVGIIFDVSGSMRGRIERARTALRAFIETSHPLDDYVLIGFNQRASLLSEFSRGEDVVQRLGSIDAQGNTALYDAIYLGVEKLRQGRQRKKALLIISDGKDNSSRYSLDQVRSRLKESDILLYCVGIRQTGSGDKLAWREELRGQMILEELAGLTGGRAFSVNSADGLEEATTQAALELRQQYSLGYLSTNQRRDGRWREIRVRVTRPGVKLQVNAKSGYFAPLGPPASSPVY